MLRRIVQTGSKCVGRNAAKNSHQTVSSGCKYQVRRGHGHAKDAHAHSNEPYAIKHHDHYPDEAYAFGIKPGDAAEGWEYMTYGVYAACTLVLVVGLSTQENGDFKVTKQANVWMIGYYFFSHDFSEIQLSINLVVERYNPYKSC